MINVVQNNFFLYLFGDKDFQLNIKLCEPIKKNKTSKMPNTYQIKSILNSINHIKTTNKVAKYKIIALLVKYLGKYVSTVNG